MSQPTILSVAASFRPQSLNRQLMGIAIAQAKQDGASIRELDYAACDAPIYREELEGETLPPGAHMLADALLESDGMMLAVPEYNWSIPGGLKNLIDWLSIDPRKPLNGKTALLMCASPSVRGGITGLLQLRVPLEHLGVWVYPHVVGVGLAQKQLAEGGLSEKDGDFLRQCIGDFLRRTKAMRHAFR